MKQSDLKKKHNSDRKFLEVIQKVSKNQDQIQELYPEIEPITDEIQV
jgi:hypothetical protein